MGRIRESLFPKERRHTYYFLRHAKESSPVYLDTDVNMSRVQSVQDDWKHVRGRKVSYISFLIQAVSQVLSRHPEANSGVHHGWFPRMALYDHITRSLPWTRQSEVEGRPLMQDATPDSDRCSLADIHHDQLDRYVSKPFKRSRNPTHPETARSSIALRTVGLQPGVVQPEKTRAAARDFLCYLTRGHDPFVPFIL